MFVFLVMNSVAVYMCSVTQSCPALSNTMDCSLRGCSVRGVLHARILEWVAISFSRDLPHPRLKSSSPELQVDSSPLRYLGSNGLYQDTNSHFVLPATQNKSYCLPHTKKETATYLFLFPTCWEEVTNCAFQNPGLREVRRLDDPCEKSPWSLGLGAEKMEAARFKREGGGCSRWCQDLPDAKAESGTLGASGQHLDMMLGEALTVVRGLVTVRGMAMSSQGRGPNPC